MAALVAHPSRLAEGGEHLRMTAVAFAPLPASGARVKQVKR